MNEEQKECPFCGSDKVDVRQESAFSSWWEAVCDDCGAQIWREKLTEALEAWNRRYKS